MPWAQQFSSHNVFSSQAWIVQEKDSQSLKHKASSRISTRFPPQLQGDCSPSCVAHLYSSAPEAPSNSSSQLISSKDLLYQDPFASQSQHITSQTFLCTPWASSQPSFWSRRGHTWATSASATTQSFHFFWRGQCQRVRDPQSYPWFGFSSLVAPPRLI